MLESDIRFMYVYRSVQGQTSPGFKTFYININLLPLRSFALGYFH